MNKAGLNIRSLRKKQNLTQVQLSELVNVSSQVVSNWERGYSVLSADDLAKLVEVFNVPSDKILGTGYLLDEGKTKESSIEETQAEKEQKEILRLVLEITDPVKKQAAIEVLKGLAGRK